MIKKILEWMMNVFEPAPLVPPFPIEKPKTRPQAKKATTRKPKMPLKKSASPKAFKENIKAEVKAGKPVKQAVAIAYAEKNAAKKTTKGKK